jgi:ArsR family transcriptional regulator
MRQAVKIFKALSDPTRLRILLLLLQRELCVCELAFTLKMEQSRISHQLRILRDTDLVEDIRDRKWTNYRIPDKTKKNLRALFDRILGGNFADSNQFHQDRKNLETCIKENIRMKKSV